MAHRSNWEKAARKVSETEREKWAELLSTEAVTLVGNLSVILLKEYCPRTSLRSLLARTLSFVAAHIWRSCSYKSVLSEIPPQ